MEIKLINLNTWFGGKFLWDEMTEYLIEEKPDILILQEAFSSTEQNVEPYLITVESLKQILGLPYSQYKEEAILVTDDETAPIGNAILSRFPLLNTHVEWLLGSEGVTMHNSDRESIPKFPRNLLHCQIEINNQTYNLMGVHGVWAATEVETDSQKSMGHKIAKYISNKSNIILTGDFNVNENTEAISAIEQHLVNVFKGERVSSFNMKQKTNPGYATAVVDFVFTSPNIKILEHKTSEANVSDHQSQIVMLDL